MDLVAPSDLPSFRRVTPLRPLDAPSPVLSYGQAAGEPGHFPHCYSSLPVRKSVYQSAPRELTKSGLYRNLVVMRSFYCAAGGECPYKGVQ
jgi:hypothetical protein